MIFTIESIRVFVGEIDEEAFVNMKINRKLATPLKKCSK